MARPTLKVEIAFDAGVTGTPTWTDITKYVRVEPGAEANHWRRDEGSTCEPSRVSFTLVNNDGRFTPGNASSPHYPNIKKGRRIRVTSVLNGETFPRFTGYVDDWKAEWPATVGHISDCRVTGSSRMAYLGRGTELRSLIEEEYHQNNPGPYFTLQEPAGAPSASDSSRFNVLAFVPAGLGADLTFGADMGNGVTGVQFAGGRYLAGGPLAAERWELLIKTTATNVGIFGVKLGLGDWALRVSAAGKFELVESGVVRATSTTSVNDGENHHLAWWVNTLGSTHEGIYVDGVREVAYDAGTITNATGLRIGADFSGGAAFTGTIAHVAGFSPGFGGVTTPIEDHAQACLNRFAGEASSDRIERYAGFGGLFSPDLALDAGMTPDLAHLDIQGMTSLAAMRAIEETEGGVLFDALDGTFTFHDRARRYEAAAFGTLLGGGGFFGGGPHGTEFTLSVAQGHIADPINPVLDDQRQVNDMINTNADGVTGVHADQDSIDDHGLYRDGKTLHTTDPDEPLLRASWTVNRYAEPLTRVSEVVVNLWNLPDDLAAVVLAAQVGTIFTISDLPDNAPSDTMHLFVEGRTDRITANEDRITFRTSPVEVFDVFMLDHPDRGLDSGYPLAY